MAQIWDMASSRYEDAPERSQSLWRGHKLDVAESRASYEVFTPIELAKVFSALEGDEEMQNVTLIGMYSGMRLNEICSLRIENIREIEGVLCFEVTEGKTKSASRIIPVHSTIMDMVKGLYKSLITAFCFTERQSLTVQTESALRGIHSVLHGLNERHWESRGPKEKFSTRCVMG